VLLAFLALNACGGGVYGLCGARNVPLAWLRGSPFTSYLVPSLILLVVVGGALSTAAVAVFAGWRQDRTLATAGGAILLGWIAAQVAIIGYVSWLQPAVAIAGLVTLVLARRLPARRN